MDEWQRLTFAGDQICCNVANYANNIRIVVYILEGRGAEARTRDEAGQIPERFL